MDIRFKCPRCSQKLSVDEEGAGMIVNCPNCNGQIEIPRCSTDNRENDDPLTNRDVPWRSEPATDAQKRKLCFYGVRFDDDVTKEEASNLIEIWECPGEK
jgi:DNA-directed RNA polymerase subunit RPC12/RpoP